MARGDRNDRVGTVIVSWRGYQATRRLLEFVGAAWGEFATCVVVDNESDSEQAAELRGHPIRPIVVEVAENLGWGGAIKLGVETTAAEGLRYCLVIDNDVEPEEQVLPLLVDEADDPEVGFVGPVTLEQGATKLTSGIDLDTGDPRVGRHRPSLPESRVADVSALQGSTLLFRTEIVERVGPIRDDYFMYWDDVEWCVRAQANGLSNRVVRDAVCNHRGSVSIGGFRGYNAVAEYMLLRNMLHFLLDAGYGEAEARSHAEWWRSHSDETTYRYPEEPPPDPAVAREVISAGIRDFEAGRRGRWPAEIDRLAKATR